MPTFPDLASWQQAEQLMQPAFIRVIDHLRKQLEESIWKGTYETVEVWANAVSDATKAEVKQLQAQFEVASPDQVATIEQALAKLPSPHSNYQLQLQHHDQQVTIDLWELCYQICFQNYDAISGMIGSSERIGSDQPVAIDGTLFDEAGDVDWNRLDRKAQQLVAQLFASLPAETVNS